MKQPKKQGKKKESLTRSLLVTLFMAIAIRSFAVQGFHVPSGSMKNTLLIGDYIFVNELAYGLHSPKYLPLTNVPIPHFGFDYRDVHRGDIVVFEYPGDRDLVVPAEKNKDYVKRCIAVAGDTVEVRAKQVYVNGSPFQNPAELRYNFPTMPKIHPDDRLFPRNNPGWNLDWYGPIRIPKKGDVIALDSKNIDSWSVFIEREGHSVECNVDGTVLIDNIPSKSYTVRRDYLWMMGDNRDNSEDSRTWGFCPRENVVGSPMVVYWSWYNPPSLAGHDPRYEFDDYDPEESQSFHIRWGRLFNIPQ
ncbi:MAG TPA: signal peptidase I [Candidatus Kapabacteria bacterium]|nr:signal peptidase I [Candidatus Kapabacteria bacterium]